MADDLGQHFTKKAGAGKSTIQIQPLQSAPVWLDPWDIQQGQANSLVLDVVQQANSEPYDLEGAAITVSIFEDYGEEPLVTLSTEDDPATVSVSTISPHVVARLDEEASNSLDFVRGLFEVSMAFGDVRTVLATGAALLRKGPAAG